tara:strand:+ start:3838 stop:5205 length:1368 start_codon:yes stop_codon:yes gene_type:complete
LKKLIYYLMNKKLLHILFYIILFSLAISNSRVSFTRPGSFMRVSNFENYNSNTLFSLSLGSEVTSLGDIVSHSSSFAYNKNYASGNSWGINYTILPYTGIDANEANSDLGYEFGFHYQNQLYTTGRSTITAGVHDVLLSNDFIHINDLSFFINFANTISSDRYTLTSVLGMGTGKLAFDPHSSTTASDSATTLGLYGAIKLKTPFLKKWGGMDLITEFISQGVNIGLTIPFTTEYAFSIGISHIENLNNFSNQSATDEEDRLPLSHDAPAICFGIKVNIPKINYTKNKKIAQDYPVLFINGRVDSSLFNAGQYIYSLQDSISILKQEVNNVSAHNVELQLNNHYYRDSLNNMILKTDINNTTQNTAMRHLSKSLRLYYQGDFQQALQEVDAAITLQPNVAVAYARKGSIFYQLNQLDRATLNWNIALKLDPEYSEVREMLNALKENKLRPVSVDN